MADVIKEPLATYFDWIIFITKNMCFIRGWWVFTAQAVGRSSKSF